MTKEDIKKAAAAYQEEFPTEYGWTCYRFTTKDDRQLAYVKYTNPHFPYKYIINCTESQIIAESLDGHKSHGYWREGDPADAILCLMLWMRNQIP